MYNIISRSQVEHNVPQMKCQVPAASVSWKLEEKEGRVKEQSASKRVIDMWGL
jgi:hypothetical protein